MEYKKDVQQEVFTITKIATMKDEAEKIAKIALSKIIVIAETEGLYPDGTTNEAAIACLIKFAEQVYQSRLSKVGGLPDNEHFLNDNLIGPANDFFESANTLLDDFRTEAQKALAAKELEIEKSFAAFHKLSCTSEELGEKLIAARNEIASLKAQIEQAGG